MGINGPTQDHLTLGWSGLAEELGKGKQVIPFANFVCMDRVTQKVDHKGEDGSATCSIAKEECHEGIVDIAIALRGEVAGQVDGNLTSRRERH